MEGQGPLDSLTSALTISRLKTDPDIDIGIFFTIIMLVTLLAITGFHQE